MGTLLIILLLSILARSQHLDEDKHTLMAAAEGQNFQRIDGKGMRDEDVEVVTHTKLQEFEDHAEMKAETNLPKETFTPHAPSPKLVTDDIVSTGELHESNNDSLSQPYTLPTPVPVQLNPSNVTNESANREEYVELSSTKKSSSVPKKGVKFEEPSVVPKKEADPKTLKPSITPRKGADPKTNKQSVTPRKEANPAVLLESNSTVTDDTAASIGDIVNSATVTKVTNVNLDGKSGGNDNKFNGTDMNMLGTEKQKPFPPKLAEANMDFRTSTPKLQLPATITSAPPTESTSNPNEIVDSEPVKPLIADPVTTEAYTTFRSKPTAATDTLDSAASDDKSESMYYTPAVVGIVLLIAIVVTVIVVGYRRLQDVWMRRHYARMDFLIDGMYDM